METPHREFLGRGAFGDVYLLTNYDPPIVMKEVKQDDSNNHLEELLVLKELAHMNVVKYLDQPIDFVYDGNSSLNFPIFMEYCEHGSLLDVITKSTINYSGATILKWSTELFTALKALNSKNMVHRDVKSGNIFLTRNFVLKLGDFGLIKRLKGDDQSLDRAGTEIYMAPELKSGSKLSVKNIMKCDVFAAGLVVWEMSERRSWSEMGKFPLEPFSCPKTEELRKLVFGCSCATTSIEDRFDVDEALEYISAESIKELFAPFIVKPEIQRKQDFLEPVEGLLIRSDDFSSMVPPGVRFSSLIDSVQSKKDQPVAKNSHLQHFLTQKLIPKIKRTTKFATGDRQNIQAFKHKTLKADWVNDALQNKYPTINEMRKNLSDQLISQCDFEELDEEIVNDIKGLLNYVEESLDLCDPNDSQYDDFLEGRINNYAPDLRLSYEVSYLLATLVLFDYGTQDYSFDFAIQALWCCESSIFTWLELVDLLDTAIQNIEELDHIFTRRKKFSTYIRTPTEKSKYTDHQWCMVESGLFRADFGDFLDYSELEFWTQDGTVVIDVESVRRALIAKRSIVCKNSVEKERKTLNLLRNNLSIYFNWSADPKIGQPEHFRYNLPRNIFDLTYGHRKGAIREYMYFLDAPPCGNRWECFGECGFETFPETLPTDFPKGLQMDYSKCNRPNLKAELKLHSLFERSLRLLHHWNYLSSFPINAKYLLEKLLKEIDDYGLPFAGFYFIYLKKDDESRLLMAFMSDNSFCNQEFEFEQSDDSFKFDALVYISLEKIRKVLECMSEQANKDFRSGDDFIDEMMFSSFERFWKEVKFIRTPDEASDSEDSEDEVETNNDDSDTD